MLYRYSIIIYFGTVPSYIDIRTVVNWWNNVSNWSKKTWKTVKDIERQVVLLPNTEDGMLLYSTVSLASDTLIINVLIVLGNVTEVYPVTTIRWESAFVDTLKESCTTLLIFNIITVMALGYSLVHNELT